MNRAIWSIIGFSLLIIGVLSICLSIVGVKLSFLVWIDYPGALFGFLIRVLMVVAGIVILALTQTNWRNI